MTITTPSRNLAQASAIDGPPGSRIHLVAAFVLGAAAVLPQLRFRSSNLQLFDIAVAAVFVLLVQRGELSIPPLLRRVLGWGWLFLLALAISSMRSPNPVAALTQLLQWAFIFSVVMPTCVSLLRFQEARRGAMFAIVCVMTVVVARALGDAASGVRRFRAYRSTSIYDSPQVAAFQVATSISLVLVALRYTRVFVHKNLYATGARLFAGALVAGLLFFLTKNLSRSGTIATCLAVLTFELGTYFRRGRPSVRHVVRLMLAAIVIVLGLSTYLQNWAPDNVLTRISSVSASDSSEISGRTDGFYDVLDIDPTYYLVGTGPDNYHRISEREIKPHNAFLLMFAEGGVVALFAFVAIFSVSLRAMWSAIASTRAGSGSTFIMMVASASSTVAYLAVATFNTQAILRGYWFFLCIGLACASLVETRRFEGLTRDANELATTAVTRGRHRNVQR